jgi:hypothetical protein
MMKFKFFLLLAGMALGAAMTACGGAREPGLVEGSDGVGTPAGKVSVENCPDAEAGTLQLIDAAHGFCFLYPENYDVFQGDDGSLTLYVRSLLNTGAPLASIHVQALDGRTIQEVIPDYPSNEELAAMSLLTIDLGGEQATVLDNMPGQDLNRRVIAVREDMVYDLMIARIGEEYGAVGEAAEELYEVITGSFQFIGIEPGAPLLAGPECPEPAGDRMLYTNEVAGYCLLLPSDYTALETSSEAANSEVAAYVDSIQDVTHAKMFISVIDADGRSLEDATEEKAAEIEAVLGEAPTWSFGIMLDGVPANQFDQVPGQDLSRVLVLVHDGRLYTLTFIPDDEAAGEAYTEMQALYDTVVDSFSFLRNQ